MSSTDTVLYLVRHGHTGLNAAGLLRGRLDPRLDAAGLAEAQRLGRLFATTRLVAVITSPLGRAQATAAEIAAAAGRPVEVDDGLIDRDYGRWAGTAGDEVMRRFGSLDAAPGVEATEPFAARVTAAVVRAADRLPPGPAAVVAHDAVNRVALAALVPELGDANAIPQRTGCWNRLERRGGLWSAPIVDAVPDDGRRP